MDSGRFAAVALLLLFAAADPARSFVFVPGIQGVPSIVKIAECVSVLAKVPRDLNSAVHETLDLMPLRKRPEEEEAALCPPCPKTAFDMPAASTPAPPAGLWDKATKRRRGVPLKKLAAAFEKANLPRHARSNVNASKWAYHMQKFQDYSLNAQKAYFELTRATVRQEMEAIGQKWMSAVEQTVNTTMSAHLHELVNIMLDALEMDLAAHDLAGGGAGGAAGTGGGLKRRKRKVSPIKQQRQKQQQQQDAPPPPMEEQEDVPMAIPSEQQVAEISSSSLAPVMDAQRGRSMPDLFDDE